MLYLLASILPYLKIVRGFGEQMQSNVGTACTECFVYQLQYVFLVFGAENHENRTLIKLFLFSYPLFINTILLSYVLCAQERIESNYFLENSDGIITRELIKKG